MGRELGTTSGEMRKDDRGVRGDIRQIGTFGLAPDGESLTCFRKVGRGTIDALEDGLFGVDEVLKLAEFRIADDTRELRKLS
jgi:hypothetical protein